jgi:hypothetical protein
MTPVRDPGAGNGVHWTALSLFFSAGTICGVHPQFAPERPASEVAECHDECDQCPEEGNPQTLASFFGRPGRYIAQTGHGWIFGQIRRLQGVSHRELFKRRCSRSGTVKPGINTVLYPKRVAHLLVVAGFKCRDHYWREPAVVGKRAVPLRNWPGIDQDDRTHAQGGCERNQEAHHSAPLFWSFPVLLTSPWKQDGSGRHTICRDMSQGRFTPVLPCSAQPAVSHCRGF